MADGPENNDPSMWGTIKEEASQASDAVRDYLPPGPLKDTYDRNVGRFKAGVGTLEETVEGVTALPDLAEALYKDPEGTLKAIAEGIPEIPGEILAEKQKEYQEAVQNGRVEEFAGKMEGEIALAVLGGGGTIKGGIKILGKLKVICRRVLEKLKKGKLPHVSDTPNIKSPRGALAAQRQEEMLQNGTGYNVSPSEWDKYPQIGRNGTYLTDQKAITDVLGDIPNDGGAMTITPRQAQDLENALGLDPGSLGDEFKIRKVDNIQNRAPRSPLEGNDQFLGPGEHLPGGGPEMVVDPISTTDGNGTSTISKVVVK